MSAVKVGAESEDLIVEKQLLLAVGVDKVVLPPGAHLSAGNANA